MNRASLSWLSALAALGAAGCGVDFAGTYKGEATESGSVKIAVVQSNDVAKNETPPHTVPDASVSVAKDGASYVVKFGSCEMKGDGNGPSMVVVKGPCDAKVANWAGKLPLSATLKFDGSGGMTMDVTGTTKNDTTVINYNWTFKGKK
jgi:hypothetical protein